MHRRLAGRRRPGRYRSRCDARPVSAPDLRAERRAQPGLPLRSSTRASPRPAGCRIVLALQHSARVGSLAPPDRSRSMLLSDVGAAHDAAATPGNSEVRGRIPAPFGKQGGSGTEMSDPQLAKSRPVASGRPSAGCLIWRVVCQPGRVDFSLVALVGGGCGRLGGWRPGAVRDVGQPDMRGSGWPQDHGSSWGAAV